MPGEDRPVHEKTKLDTSVPRWCNNKPRTRNPYLVKNGYLIEQTNHLDAVTGKVQGIQTFKLVEDTGSLECRYDAAVNDPQCAGCMWIMSGENYAKEITKKGT